MKKNNEIFHRAIRPLRKAIDDIDAQILSLLAQRQTQVEKVTALKEEHNQAVHHPAREEDLISRLRTRALENKMDPDFIEDIYRLILKHSRAKQNHRMGPRSIGDKRRILVVGGNGQMGALFAELFKKSGYPVGILAENNWDQVDKLCAHIDLALICVPIEKTGDVIEAIAPHLPSHALLADLTSIKKEPMEKMMTAHKGPVLGLHPLFGPTSSVLEKQIVVATPGRDPKEGEWLLEQLALWGAIIVPSTPEEHDGIMEMVQALRHFATFCFGHFLHQKQLDIHRSLEFSSPIYRLELGMVGRLFAQDAGLYAQIIFATRERRELLKEYIDCLVQHKSMLDNDNRQEFMDQFQTIAQWF
ncbi:MAG: bifunctional chorismate mutase/prephenate dehydrogenase, partial [Desulfovibrionales bacterium]|nr:bifunctional chorismate mutase/prephenate dehydrogenase [Desulfovibrionales bacterium]